MAYTQTSTYEYITGDELENFSFITYVNVDAKYTEARIMAQVTIAEEIINELTYPNSPFTAGAAPDGVKTATKLIASRFMDLQMVKDGWKKPDEIKITTIIDELVTIALSSYGYNPVDSIPMQGIDKYSG